MKWIAIIFTPMYTKLRKLTRTFYNMYNFCPSINQQILIYSFILSDYLLFLVITKKRSELCDKKKKKKKKFTILNGKILADGK